MTEHKPTDTPPTDPPGKPEDTPGKPGPSTEGGGIGTPPGHG